MPGRAVCPALGTGRRWTPWHAERPPGASGGANEVGHGLGCRVGSARAPGWLVALVAGGRACQHRPARSLHPGRGGRTRLPARGPLAGLSQAPPVSPTPPYSTPPLLEGWARPTAICSIADRDPVAPDQGYQRDVTDRVL